MGVIACLWKRYAMSVFERICGIQAKLVQSRAVLFFLQMQPIFKLMHAHTLLPSRFHCCFYNLLPAGTLTWSLNLLCFSLLWISVHSACEWRQNELILPASAQGMVMPQTARWGKCNEHAPFFEGGGDPPRWGSASSLSNRSSMTWFKPPTAVGELHKNKFMKMFNFFL